MRPKLRDGLVAGALVLAIIGVVSALLLPVFMSARAARVSIDRSNLKEIVTGLMMYGADWDERMPPAEGWSDIVNPYARNESLWVCAGLVKPGLGQFGHALHRSMAGASLDTLKHPERTVLVFDSTDLSRSAVSRLSQLPNPGRNDGKNAIAYADGHSKFVGVGEAP